MNCVKRSLLPIGAALIFASLSVFAAGARYQYKVVTLSDPKTESKVIQVLEEMDAKGWEFMGAYAGEYLAYPEGYGTGQKGKWGRLIYRKLKTQGFEAYEGAEENNPEEHLYDDRIFDTMGQK